MRHALSRTKIRRIRAGGPGAPKGAVGPSQHSRFLADFWREAETIPHFDSRHHKCGSFHTVPTGGVLGARTVRIPPTVRARIPQNPAGRWGARAALAPGVLRTSGSASSGAGFPAFCTAAKVYIMGLMRSLALARSLLRRPARVPHSPPPGVPGVRRTVSCSSAVLLSFASRQIPFFPARRHSYDGSLTLTRQRGVD